VKSPLSFEKTTSSALVCATIGWLVASLSPAQAALTNTTNSAASVESSTQGLSASTDLAKLNNLATEAPTAGGTAVAASTNPAPNHAITTNSVVSAEDHLNSVPSTQVSETNIKDLKTPTSLQAQALPIADQANDVSIDHSLEPMNVEATDDSMGEITNASQFRDVQPSDWAYEALDRIVQKYGCLVGYPDGTYRGNRALSRYEFAAGLNACLKQVEALIASQPNSGSRQDLETLQRLTEDFRSELASLGTRVDNLEGRTQFLEDHQFSTTTKLFGQAIIGVQGRGKNTADFFPVDGKKETADPGTNINVIHNVQLSLLTQLSPRSLLLTGLQAGGGSTQPRLTNDVLLGYEGDTNDQLVVSDLTYRQLFGSNLAVIVGPVGVNPVNVFRGANRVESAGQGPLSFFAQRNPILNIGSGRGGVGFDLQVNPRVSLQGVYSASLPQDTVNGGLFGGRSGSTTAGVQLTLSPTDNIDVALDYINAYSPNGFLGTGIGDDQLTAGQPIKTNAVGATLEWRVTPQVTFGTWGGYTTSKIPDTDGRVETTNWMFFLNFPDLFGRGNLGGIYVGQTPRIVSSDLTTGQNIPNLLAGGVGSAGEQPGQTTHLEVFYRYRLSDNVSITPGVIMLFNPDHAPGSDTVTIGALRTTFTF